VSAEQEKMLGWSVYIRVIAKNTAVFPSVHPKCIHLEKGLEMSKQRGEVPIRGERGGSPWARTPSGRNWGGVSKFL
jgi:hypothetical protein